MSTEGKISFFALYIGSEWTIKIVHFQGDDEEKQFVEADLYSYVVSLSTFRFIHSWLEVDLLLHLPSNQYLM